jgi:hypothetical protein
MNQWYLRYEKEDLGEIKKICSQLVAQNAVWGWKCRGGTLDLKTTGPYGDYVALKGLRHLPSLMWGKQGKATPEDQTPGNIHRDRSNQPPCAKYV